MKKQRFNHRLWAAFLSLAVVAVCTGCKPSDKAGGPANADSAASSSPSAPNK